MAYCRSVDWMSSRNTDPEMSGYCRGSVIENVDRIKRKLWERSIWREYLAQFQSIISENISRIEVLLLLDSESYTSHSYHIFPPSLLHILSSTARRTRLNLIWSPKGPHCFDTVRKRKKSESENINQRSNFRRKAWKSNFAFLSRSPPNKLISLGSTGLLMQRTYA